MRKLEKRILLYLNNVDPTKKRVKDIHLRLDVEYSYLCRTLRLLSEKGILIRNSENSSKSIVYDLNNKGRELLKDES